ncbi:MAG TPA: GMC family oxidoreductase [Candidatus Angelobacter sp.]|jgi:choline dehydrogenase-like flavoprotein
MISNGKNITTPQKAQVCVIGSGPAGITAAWELSNAGLDVILLDGGRQLDYSNPDYFEQSWPDKVKLYNGLADGNFSKNEREFLIVPYDENPGPTKERERVYGGTSTHWGGQSRPLDPIVFEKRPGFPGWPITRETLDPYYKKAVALNHLYGDYGKNGANFTPEFWVSELKKQGQQAAVPNLTNFNAEMYQFMGSDWLNFATRTFNGKPIGDSSVRVIVNATLLNIVEQGGSVRSLNVASMNDDPNNPQKATEFTVTADIYILACGAVANARQLLLSGVGNKLVGHYFMCHPLSQSSIIQTTKTYLSTAENNLMNPDWSDPTGNINGFTGRFIATADTARSNGIGRCWFWANNQFDAAPMYFEMAPNYDSYVTLTKATDPVSGQKPDIHITDPVFGQQQTHIHWAFSDLDKKTYETNCSLFSKATNGAISSPSWESLANQWTVNGHHIGTTRMSASTAPTEGVVDENLKVHGVDNLYIGGASVFASAGISNPTMTIITLSIRLAEHVQAQIPKTKAKAGQA